MIGICGGSASGKTTVANKIISELGVPWVTLLSMDSFYKVGFPQIHRLFPPDRTETTNAAHRTENLLSRA